MDSRPRRTECWGHSRCHSCDHRLAWPRSSLSAKRSRSSQMSSQVEPVLISATPRAVAMLRKLVRAHGPLAIFQSGGCCDGSLPLCLMADDLAPGPGDLLLGRVAEVPFYIDAEQFHRWGEPA